MFSNLLISENNIGLINPDSSKKYVNPYFELQKYNNMWYWGFSAKFIEKTKLEDMPIVDHEPCSSWKAARDEALSIFSTFFPEHPVPTQMRQATVNSYCIVGANPKLVSYLSVSKGFHKKWKFCGPGHEYLNPPTKTVVIQGIEYTDQYFNTRKQAVSFLYQYIENNLAQLYYQNHQNYQKEVELIKNYSKTTNSDFIYLYNWWLLFVKPEVDLDKVFSNI